MSGKVYKRTKPSAISLNPRKKTAHDMFREQFLRGMLIDIDFLPSLTYQQLDKSPERMK